jgi:protein involved in polysaccharide export with SLBB domain
MFDSSWRVRMRGVDARVSTVLSVLMLVFVVGSPAAWAQDGQSGGDSPTAGRSGPVPSSPSDDEYTFGTGDVARIEVFGRDGLSTTVTVDPAGRVQVPMLGTVEVAGRTPAELTGELTQRYQLLDPGIDEVLVSVARYNSRTLTVIGQVGSPGLRSIPDLWEVLLTAGGMTEQAATGRVQIVRRERTPDEPRTLFVDLSRGIERTPAAALPELRPKDTIVVPALDARSPEGDAFRIFGQVGEPGNYPLSLADDVIEALGVAGGPNENADLGQVRLLRRNSLGSMAYEIDLEGYLYEADPPLGLRLRPGDTITVPEERGLLARISEGLGPFLSVASVIVLIQRANRN